MGQMCSSNDSEEQEQRKRSRQIDLQIEEDSKRLKKECKILLLGSGESGKSTVVKQMKIIHQNGYSVEDLMKYRITVLKNLLESAKNLVQAMVEFHAEPVHSRNKRFAEYIESFELEPGPDASLYPELSAAVKSLMQDPSYQEVMTHQNEFYLMDSAPYFFEESTRLCTPDYIPNEEDVLRARTKTTGIYETRFTMGQLSIHMFDVGGQRSERKKWIHCFEDVTSIIFCVALSEYDQVLLEEQSQNRMVESLTLFDSIVNSRWFTGTSIILFLNKVDLFKTKLQRSPLVNIFPDYAGGDDLARAAKYLLWRFSQLNRAHLALYPHLTCATDTSNIRLVFAAVKDTLLHKALEDTGIL